MSKLGKILKGAVGTVALLGVAGAGYLAISPPALLKVATNYSAKIVCSNVFIAGRDAEEVLALDVQAPGHPVLKQISMRVDEDRQRIETRVFGFFAPAVSQYRPGLGCTNLHEAELTAVEMADPAAPGSGIWPEGNEVADVSPAVQAVLENTALTGQGARAA
ncbi:MAG: 6-aminohexanoate hydrolase, partial [Pseudomonadota bacterium]|nr:6-aminohexanoate hydrolase [Pseudomonadota bacterium]